jgi:hypothetical protein
LPVLIVVVGCCQCPHVHVPWACEHEHTTYCKSCSMNMHRNGTQNPGTYCTKPL